MKLAFAALALSIFASAASAQQAHDWNGLYGGIARGFGGTSVFDDFIASDRTARPDGTGALASVQVGYNKVLANALVLGIEADAGFANIEGSAPLDTGSQKFVVAVGNMASVRARLGYQLPNSSLVYIAVGAARAQVAGEAYFGALGDIYAGSYGGWRNGWVLGLGYERALSFKTSLWVELRQADFGATYTHVPGMIAFDMDLKATDLRFGVNFHF